jgi:LytR cell envelope-related transcriptional attenuator
VDHYAPTHDLAQPWRTRTLIVTGIAAVELLALVAVGVVVLGKGWFQHVRASAAPKAAQSAAHHAARAALRPTAPAAKPKIVLPARPMVTRVQTGLLVLNGNGQSGAAGAEARAVRAHGYPVVAVGNAKRNDYAASIVMYRPGYDREARRLAHDVGIAVVSPLDGLLPSQLKGAKLMIILGR